MRQAERLFISMKAVLPEICHVSTAGQRKACVVMAGMTGMPEDGLMQLARYAAQSW